jgi:methoxymalonate biosynthesis acyl carrier protein
MTDSSPSMIESSLKDFIMNEIGVRQDLPPIGENTELIKSGVLDSLSVLKLVMFIETKFGVKVGADEVVPDNFETIGAMTTFVRKKNPSSP